MGVVRGTSAGGQDRIFTPLQLPSPVVAQIPLLTLEPRVLRPREGKGTPKAKFS